MTMLALILTAVAVIAAGFTGVALTRLVRRAPRPARRRLTRPSVLLLRPVDAPTPAELENLAAPIEWDGELEHVVLAPFRPRLPDAVRWHPSDPPSGNRKVRHVLYALDTLDVRGRRVLVVDADVRVDAALVEALVDAVEDGAALATAAPSPQAPASWGASVAAGVLGHTHHAFLALDAMSAGARAVCGKAMALTPAATAVLRDLTHHIGEDLELSLRLHQRHERVALADVGAVVPMGRVPLGSAAARFSRWMQVLKAHRPDLYPTVPLLFAPTLPLAAAALWLGQVPLLVAVTALVTLRVALSVWLGRRHRVPVAAWVSAWRWVPAEALMLAAFIASVPTRTVSWRGRRFSVASGGRMHPLPRVVEARRAA